jgi:hypothetical protein
MWRITRSLGSRTLTFFKRATGGTAVTIKHQVFGATLDIANTNAESTNVRFDAARVTNQMTVRGGFKQYEFTAELARGWDEADDAYTIHELKRSDANFANRKDVFRKWVLNEAGDYIGLRSEITAPFVPTWYGDSDADALIAQLTPLRRRRLLPTLTLADDETPIGNISGVEVEWYNEAEAEWQPIPNWGCELLEHECGIYFASEELPEEFVRPSDLKFRVTATIQSDFAIGYTAPFDVNSPLQDLREAVVYVPDRYQFRQVSPLSKYDSDVNGMTPTRNSLKVDDLVAMTAYADEQKLIWDLLDIGGKVVLEGVDHQSYDVGDRVTKIAGVEVSFEAKTGTARYPQIMAIERNIPSQQTVLHLQRLSPPWGRGR